MMPSILLGMEQKKYLDGQSDSADGGIGGLDVAGDLDGYYTGCAKSNGSILNLN